MSELVPKLRFSGFEGAWVEKAIGDRLSKVIDYRGKAPPKVETGVPLITARNVRKGFLDFSADEYIDENLYNSWMNRGLPEVNDVLFTTEAPLGNVALYPAIGNYALGQRIITLQPDKAKLNSLFLFQYLLGPIGQDAIEKRGTGSTAKGIKSKVFVKILMAAPTLPEQQKIAAFLSAVDAKIDAVKRKLNALERYKKGLMQQIFSQKLRFKQDDGSDFPEWEEKRLGSLCSIKTGKLDANAMVPHGAFPFFTCAREVYRIDEFAFDTDALLISGNGANVGYIHQYNGKFNAYQRTYILSDFIDINKIFLFYFLEKQLKARIYTEAKEGNTPYIVMGTLTDMSIDMPSPPEQQKIADFLSAVDAKIDAIKAQIEKLEAFKKGLLQQMFV